MIRVRHKYYHIKNSCVEFSEQLSVGMVNSTVLRQCVLYGWDFVIWKRTPSISEEMTVLNFWELIIRNIFKRNVMPLIRKLPVSCLTMKTVAYTPSDYSYLGIPIYCWILRMYIHSTAHYQILEKFLQKWRRILFIHMGFFF